MSTIQTQSTAQKNTERASISDVKRDVATLKEDVKDVAATQTEVVADAVGTTIDATKQAAATAGDAHKAMCRYISDHPTSSVLIALGVGAVLSRLIPRS